MGLHQKKTYTTFFLIKTGIDCLFFNQLECKTLEQSIWIVSGRGRENKENERNLEDGYGGSERGRRGERGGRMSNGPGRGGRGGRGGGRLGSRTFQSRDKPGPGFPRSIDTWNNPSADEGSGDKMGKQAVSREDIHKLFVTIFSGILFCFIAYESFLKLTFQCAK